MKKIILFLLVPFLLPAQTLTRSVLPATGESSNAQLQWTLGEVATTRSTAGGYTLSQGFQQPVASLVLGGCSISGIIRASQGTDDAGNAPMVYQALNHTFTSDVAGQGRVSVPVLEIRGGSDIIEKLLSTEKTTPLLPGEVVIMDENNPLAARRSTKSYQKMVIGVVSGAGGISHGLSLQQEGILDGDTPVAVAGRVKVKVVGDVQPGDLLTTSDEPGKAMRAKTRKKSFGAIIGKALSKPDAEGLVLMLVNLQ